MISGAAVEHRVREIQAEEKRAVRQAAEEKRTAPKPNLKCGNSRLGTSRAA